MYQLLRAFPSTVTTTDLMIAGPSPVLSTDNEAPVGVTNVEISTCGQTSARSWVRWSRASYNPTATAETLTTRAATAMKVSGSRYQGRSAFITFCSYVLSLGHLQA